MGGPPKISAKTIKFPEAGKHVADETTANLLRETIVQLRWAIGNDGALEGRLLDCRRFVGFKPLNVDTIDSEIVFRAVSTKKIVCKHPNAGECLVFHVLQTIQAWHEYVALLSGDYEAAKKKFDGLFEELLEVVVKGISAYRVAGTEIEGFHLEV
jgi:hypothetical protein